MDSYWAPGEWVAFRDEIGLLWMDHIDRDEHYASDDDEHPSDEKPLLYNESMAVWIGLADERGEWYRLTDPQNDRECFVLCSHSLQHDAYERHLTVVGHEADGEFVEGAPSGEWIVDEPTPHSPRAILS